MSLFRTVDLGDSPHEADLRAAANALWAVARTIDHSMSLAVEATAQPDVRLASLVVQALVLERVNARRNEADDLGQTIEGVAAGVGLCIGQLLAAGAIDLPRDLEDAFLRAFRRGVRLGMEQPKARMQ